MADFVTQDEFNITHGGFAVRLRPTLRAAMRLERLHDGFPGLLAKLGEYDTSTVRAIILTAATDRDVAAAFLGALARLPLSTHRPAITEALGGLCAAFLMTSEDESAAPASTKPAKPVTWAQAYADLYRIGTGWLGWTPADTLASTPAEIGEALEGRLAFFKAQHGITDESKAEPTEPADENTSDPEFDRRAFNALRASLM